MLIVAGFLSRTRVNLFWFKVARRVSLMETHLPVQRDVVRLVWANEKAQDK